MDYSRLDRVQGCRTPDCRTGDVCKYCMDCYMEVDRILPEIPNLDEGKEMTPNTIIATGLELAQKAHKRPYSYAMEYTFHSAQLRWRGGHFGSICETQNPINNAAYMVHAANHFEELAKEVLRLTAIVDGFCDEIAHGDDEHRAWLKAKCDEIKTRMESPNAN